MAKSKVMCDTDVLIDYWDIKSARHADTKDIIEKKIGLDQVVISAITKMELLAGAANKAEETKINKMVRRFNIALINNQITNEALQLFENNHLSHDLAIPDCFIGATAKTIGVELFTYNTKDFKFIPKLKLFPIL
jgi:predicted nucleic acid-binding protein